MMYKKTFTLSLMAWAISALNALDSTNTESNQKIESKTLAKQVVSATASGSKDYTLAPASISVVTSEELNSRPVRDLAEALANVPGVSIDSGVGKTGGYGISIRGMDASYTLILVDGKRINGSDQGSIFPNGFGQVVTSFMPPMNAIERIEVIRGPASTLYGSDAIGGVVNIITKKKFDKWGASVGVNYTFQEKKYFGDTQGFNFYTAGPLNNAKNLGLSLRGTIYNRNAVKSDDLKVIPGDNGNTIAGRNTIVGLAPMTSYNVGGRLNYSSLDSINGIAKNNVYLDLDFSQQNYDNSTSLLGTNDKTKGGYADYMNIWRGNAILAHKGVYINGENTLSHLSIDNSIQYNLTMNPERFVPSSSFPSGVTQRLGVKPGDSRDIQNHDLILDHKTNMKFLVNSAFNANLSVGARYWYNAFKDNILAAGGTKALQDQHIGAIFAETELGFIDRIFLTLGARGNLNSKFGGNISPRAYLSYKAIDKWLVFKGGVSTGYKTPGLNQMVNGVASISGQGKNPIYGSPNLKPETSINYELSALSDNDYFSFSLTGFFTQFADKITSISGIANNSPIPGLGITCNATNGGTCGYYINASRAISYGAEVTASIKPISVGYGDLGLDLAYTYNKTEITQKGQTNLIVGAPLSNIPLHSFNASLTYDSRYFGAYIREEVKAGIYRGTSSAANTELINALGAYYKPYYLTHLGFNIKPTHNLKINLAIYNLFDFDFIDYKKYDATNYANAYNYIREGRRYYANVVYEF